MPNGMESFNITEPPGVEFTRGDIEGWINCVDENGVRVRLQMKAAILVQLLSMLQRRLGTHAQGGQNPEEPK